MPAITRACVALIGGVCLVTPLMAQMGSLVAQRQAMLNDLLGFTSPRSIASDRLACLSGEMAKGIALARARGSSAMPDAADYCVTVLTRSARDGVRSLLEDARSSGPTSASALDNGFMLAYAKGEPIPAGLPSMATLKPIAERCLAMAEPNVRLCYATGSAFGRRAARGELVIVG